jgi:hypothetical protein
MAVTAPEGKLEDRPPTRRELNDLALSLMRTGETGRALECNRLAMMMLESIEGPWDPMLVTVLINVRIPFPPPLRVENCKELPLFAEKCKLGPWPKRTEGGMPDLVRCPYCVLHYHFRPMILTPECMYLCDNCGHVTSIEQPDVKCSCRKCNDCGRRPMGMRSNQATL